MQKRCKKYRIKPIQNPMEEIQKGVNEQMNFYDKKVKKIVSIVILVIIFAMVATMIIPYLM